MDVHGRMMLITMSHFIGYTFKINAWKDLMMKQVVTESGVSKLITEEMQRCVLMTKHNDDNLVQFSTLFVSMLHIKTHSRMSTIISFKTTNFCQILPYDLILPCIYFNHISHLI